ncbi:MAG: hypothetical protein AAF567_04870 [Actinomycetota bacterium]
MAKSKTTPSDERTSRYEFRVWGKHRKARKLLAELADRVLEEEFDDCYLLVDDPTWNAKVRDNELKIKELVAERKGFEQWASDRPRSAKAAPTPFDELFEELRLDRPQRGKSYNLPKEVDKLDPDSGVRAVFVTKHRRRYYIGDLIAEVTDIDIHETDRTLRTLSIEGDDLKELTKLRKQLGIKGEDNVAMHQLIEAETSD